MGKSFGPKARSALCSGNRKAAQAGARRMPGAGIKGLKKRNQRNENCVDLICRQWLSMSPPGEDVTFPTLRI
jgi:hypothetical protein